MSFTLWTNTAYLLPIAVVLQRMGSERCMPSDAAREVIAAFVCVIVVSTLYHYLPRKQRNMRKYMRSLDHTVANCTAVLVLAVCISLSAYDRHTITGSVGLFCLSVCFLAHATDASCLALLGIVTWIGMDWGMEHRSVPLRDIPLRWPLTLLCILSASTCFLLPEHHFPYAHGWWHIFSAAAASCLLLDGGTEVCDR